MIHKALIDITTGLSIKAPCALIASVVTYLTGGEYLAFSVLLVLATLDVLTGLYKAWHNNSVSSTRFRHKIMHYIGYSTVIISLNQVLLIAPYLGFLVDFTVLFFAAGEIISIMENLEESGMPMPTYIKKKLLDITSRKEERYAEFIKRPIK